MKNSYPRLFCRRTVRVLARTDTCHVSLRGKPYQSDTDSKHRCIRKEGSQCTCTDQEQGRRRGRWGDGRNVNEGRSVGVGMETLLRQFELVVFNVGPPLDDFNHDLARPRGTRKRVL
jgi:hypothetical protein